MNWFAQHIHKTGIPRGVIHVGGHDGNEESWYRSWGAKSVWFEPLPDKFAGLKAKGLDAHCYALGSSPGKAKLNLSTGRECCSLLRPTGHLEMYPQFPFEGDIEVEVRTLDSFGLKGYDMLVLDAQGYELEILKGAEQTLMDIDIVLCEVQIIELYENAPFFNDIYRKLSDFRLLDIHWVNGVQKGWGDALFLRKGKTADKILAGGMMELGLVTNEDPACRWAHMEVDGRSRVLDLGCGFHDEATRTARLGTPHHYLARKPESYLGIDQNRGDIDLLRKELGDHFRCEQITHPEQLRRWLEDGRITHLKSDVEGAEIYLTGIAGPLPGLEAAAIEVHGHDTRRAVRAWLEGKGLAIYRIDRQAHCHDVHILYARRRGR